MQLQLPTDVLQRMRHHLFMSGSREIGGILMGEEIGDQVFQIVDFSVDTSRGTRAQFVRDADHHDEALSAFFERTGSEYGRFNYLGEWHSHPSFNVDPSLQDVRAMQDLVDGSGGVDFAVLFISRLRWYWRFECSAHLFVRGHPPSTVSVSRV
ncbi:Mov34/MPN/PAD-1 family protein [Yangia mangrovi]|uniref:Mov34/MPN/PAD-1 family protein n=1 Tax=Alloyangia mangrovi TaxID=1779329 RepID=A0A2A3K2H2_9RHOB|nr:Mov34/MPN/PAD-1 family protein [Alloyangia mangrovi]MCT4372029.1 Mov34/MPN/PAD-1 family protein [Alloyangia mangrovi]